MSDTMIPKREEKKRTGRRAFFGHLVAALGGGLTLGSVLPRVFSSRSEKRKTSVITLSRHPLAVSRSKEGSQSNV